MFIPPVLRLRPPCSPNKRGERAAGLRRARKGISERAAAGHSEAAVATLTRQTVCATLAL